MMSDQKPKKLNFGQAIIFNPFLLHGNRVLIQNLLELHALQGFKVAINLYCKKIVIT